jgi:D-glycero-D-manno-heptose 1,7-bisphosphate phosphatase
MTARRRPAVFLDRDGTLIEDVGYPRDPQVLQLRSGVAWALRELRREGFALVVVSNQSGVGRGMISPQEMRDFHRAFVSAFDAADVTFDAVEYCPHAPDAGCDCRKPEPGLLLRAARHLGLDVAASWLVGDK